MPWTRHFDVYDDKENLCLDARGGIDLLGLDNDAGSVSGTDRGNGRRLMRDAVSGDVYCLKQVGTKHCGCSGWGGSQRWILRVL